MAKRCKATKVDGTPCRSEILLDSGFCLMHDPSMATKAAKARLDGGLTVKRRLRGEGVVLPEEAPPAPRSVEDAREFASWAVRAVVTGELSPRVAGEVAKLLREFRAGVAEVELADRIKELEAAVSEARKLRAV